MHHLLRLLLFLIIIDTSETRVAAVSATGLKKDTGTFEVTNKAGDSGPLLFARRRDAAQIAKPVLQTSARLRLRGFAFSTIRNSGPRVSHRKLTCGGHRTFE